MQINLKFPFITKDTRHQIKKKDNEERGNSGNFRPLSEDLLDSPFS